MLYNFASSSKVTYVTKKYKVFFEKHKSRLSADELKAIYDYINKLIDESKDRFNPGWAVAGSWYDTPLQVIYGKACDTNEENSAYLYGLLVKETFIEHRNDDWYVISQQEQGRNFEQNSYFRKK